MLYQPIIPAKLKTKLHKEPINWALKWSGSATSLGVSWGEGLYRVVTDHGTVNVYYDQLANPVAEDMATRYYYGNSSVHLFYIICTKSYGFRSRYVSFDGSSQTYPVIQEIYKAE